MTIRSDVVGSLLRPELLKEARRRWEGGQIGAAELKQVEDRAVNEAVDFKKPPASTSSPTARYAATPSSVTCRRSRRVRQVRRLGHPVPRRGGEKLIFKRPVVVDKLRWRHECAPRVRLPPRPTDRPSRWPSSAPAGGRLLRTEKSASAYPTRDTYLADVVDFTRREVEELVRLGATYIQSTRRSTRRCWIPRCAKATASAAAIPTS